MRPLVVASLALLACGCIDDTPLAVDCDMARQRLVNMRECFQQRGCVVEEPDYTWVKRQVAECDGGAP
jgi:hypothetical protein